MPDRNNKGKQEHKLKKDEKAKQSEGSKAQKSVDTTVSIAEDADAGSHLSSELIDEGSTKRPVIDSPKRPSPDSAQGKDEFSPSTKRLASSFNEIIAYVESVSVPKRNRKDTTDYSDVVLQVDGAITRRAICFSDTKRQLLVEKKKNKTAVKISRYSLAKDSETIYINDMTYISKPRPEEYSFQFQETFASHSNE